MIFIKMCRDFAPETSIEINGFLFTFTYTPNSFMTACVENGSLVFPEAGKVEDVEREARIMLAWLRKRSYWITRGGRRVSVPVALLELLPKIRDAELADQIEEELKKH